MIDDAKDTLNIIAACLRRQSKELHIITANQGETALQILGTTRIDVVVTDLNMPGRVDGYELLKHLAKTHPNLPVIVLSADSEASNRLKGLRFAQFLNKSSSLNEILGAILAQVRQKEWMVTPGDQNLTPTAEKPE